MAGVAAEEFQYTVRIDAPESDVVQVYFHDPERHRALVLGCGGPETQSARLREVCETTWRSVRAAE